MILRTVLLSAAALALVACEPVKTENEPTTTTASAGIATPEGLSRDQRGIWNTYSDAGKKIVSDCMATGKSFSVCSA